MARSRSLEELEQELLEQEDAERGFLGPGGLSFLVWIVLLTGLLSAALVLHVHSRSQSIFLGYRIGEKRALQRELFEEGRQLRIQARARRTPERLLRAASNELSLRPPRGEDLKRLAAPEVRTRLAQERGLTGEAPVTTASAMQHGEEELSR